MSREDIAVVPILKKYDRIGMARAVEAIKRSTPIVVLYYETCCQAEGYGRLRDRDHLSVGLSDPSMKDSETELVLGHSCGCDAPRYLQRDGITSVAFAYEKERGVGRIFDLMEMPTTSDVMSELLPRITDLTKDDSIRGGVEEIFRKYL